MVRSFGFVDIIIDRTTLATWLIDWNENTWKNKTTSAVCVCWDREVVQEIMHGFWCHRTIDNVANKLGSHLRTPLMLRALLGYHMCVATCYANDKRVGDRWCPCIRMRWWSLMRNSALCRPPFASFLCQSLTDDSSSSTHAESGPASLKFHPKHCLTTDRERKKKVTPMS